MSGQATGAERDPCSVWPGAIAAVELDTSLRISRRHRLCNWDRCHPALRRSMLLSDPPVSRSMIISGIDYAFRVVQIGDRCHHSSTTRSLLINDRLVVVRCGCLIGGAGD